MTSDSIRRARRHVMLLVVMTCAVWMSISAIDTANRRKVGSMKGADFVHFYTLGHLASTHRIDALYDMKAMHETQIALVPDSKPFLYPAVYPPQVPVLFMPVTAWSFTTALFVWTGLTMLGYGLILWSAWKPVSTPLPDWGLLTILAAAFPPFWMLVLYGQISVLVLAAFWAGWMALERRRDFLAGAAFALLAIKPQFGIPLAVVVLARRDWAMLCGAVASVGMQAAIAWAVLGPEAFHGFASTLAITFNNVDLLEATPIYSHSLRTLTRLVPNVIGIPLWIVGAALVLWCTTRVWRSEAPVRVRVGTVILASVLVNPHVIVYDATVLALPLIWFAAYVQEDSRRGFAASYWKTVCWLFVAFFVPTSPWIGLQVSVLLMIWMLVLITRAALSEGHLGVASPYKVKAA